MILGVLLALLGAAIVRAGYAPQAADEEAEVDAAPDWRGWSCIIGGLLAFIALGKFGGLVPATLALVFISALGDRQHTVKSAALLSAGVTLLAWPCSPGGCSCSSRCSVGVDRPWKSSTT